MSSSSAIPAPFFAAPPAPAATRRLLLVSYSFPPDSSIGALRWEKLLGYAATRGWQADVLMMDPATAEVRDDSRLANLPPGTRLWTVARHTPGVRHIEQWLLQHLRKARGASDDAPTRASSAAPGWTGPIVEPGFRGRIRGLKREYLARVHFLEWSNWARDAARLGRALAAQTHYDLVVSSGPPQMAHEAARMIALDTGLPFVMDLRDQFHAGDTQPPELRSHSWFALTKRYERRCVETARLVVANTKAIEAIMRARYPAWGSRLVTVMNGADVDVHSARPFAPRFTVTHAGSLYNGRDPRPLFRGCKSAIEELGVGPDEFRIHLFGDDVYDGIPVATIAEQEGVGAFTLAERAMPRARAIRLQEESAILVILPQFQMECIPGKLFDYVQLSSWILALSEPDTATELLLRGTGADIVSPNDPVAIGHHIAARYRDYKAGRRPVPVNADGRFNREAQAKLLFDAIDTRVLQRLADSACATSPAVGGARRS